MLQKMRDNAQSWVAKVIVGVIVLIFALTGWESISRFGSNDQNAAAVNGTEITKFELEQAVALQRRQLVQQLQQLNDNFDPNMIDDGLLRQSVLDGLIERAVLVEGARDFDLRISEPMIDQLILSTPDFQVEGEFDANRFDIVIRNMGLGSRLAFRDLVRQELLLAQLRNAFEATAFATRTERLQLARLEEQTRDFAVIELPILRDEIDVAEEEIETYYTANADQFMTEEQVVLEVLELSRNDFFEQVEVDEQALQALYEREIGNLTEQRRASHILIEVTDEVSEEQALEQAQAARERLDAGEKFAQLVEEVSDDIGTAASGGDLGYTVRGSFDPEFDDALFALEEGEVSDPVRTSFGYHLIKLTGMAAPEMPSLDSMREGLVAELKAEQVERRYVEASRELANLSYESPDLAEPARALGLEVETIGPVGREGGEGLAANPRVMTAAFEEEVLQDGLNSQLLELDADTSVVIRVKEHMRAKQRPLEEVSADIADTLSFQKAVEQTRGQAEELVTALESNSTEPQQVAEQLAASWESHEAINRSNNELPQMLLRNVFAMPRPSEGDSVYGHARQADGSQWIVELRGVATPESLEASAESDLYKRYIAGQTGQQDFTALQESLQERADVERF
ncbi:SurA N-terminal domain-containing protein [Halopseudomonas salina]|uniref:Periplasmic chaperone PpiD n=1 Tax=Halopseudomonas salina TaxID=1323744 RepID=A0ABQ1Q1T4_9GAMM|nr:SurA N-terminal domain-containing protein [Halopseudomonas salina]GGD10082.1 peptidylprolyl isomerase [Halopseudomonas salina]